MELSTTEIENARATFCHERAPESIAAVSFTPRYSANAGTPVENTMKAMFIPIPNIPQTMTSGNSSPSHVPH